MWNQKKKAIGTKDLFSIDWVKKSGITNEMVPTVKKRGWERKRILCNNVFNMFFQIVINDIIDNDVVFIAPVSPSFSMFMKEKGDIEMKRILNNPGIYGSVDFIKSSGKVYSVRLDLPYAGIKRQREVRINHSNYQRIVKRVNEGYFYCGIKTVKFSRYIKLMTEKFPTLDEEIIKNIIKNGCRKLVHNMVNHKLIALANKTIKFNAYIYTPHWGALKTMANNGEAKQQRCSN
jgi:hypothetical protein